MQVAAGRQLGGGGGDRPTGTPKRGTPKSNLQFDILVFGTLCTKSFRTGILIFGRPKNATHDWYLDGRPRARTDGQTHTNEEICFPKIRYKKQEYKLLRSFYVEIVHSPLV